MALKGFGKDPRQKFSMGKLNLNFYKNIIYKMGNPKIFLFFFIKIYLFNLLSPLFKKIFWKRKKKKFNKCKGGKIPTKT